MLGQERAANSLNKGSLVRDERSELRMGFSQLAGENKGAIVVEGVEMTDGPSFVEGSPGSLDRDYSLLGVR